MQTGILTKKGDNLVGKIETLTFSTNIALFPNENRTGNNPPDYRAFCGKGELGAGWTKTGDNCGDYIALRLDGPGLPGPIWFNVYADEDGKTHTVTWKRPE